MTIIWAVVLFGLLIFFHELGHFVLAKLVGVKVLKFSLGFGPRVVGKKIGETEYLISAFPLGGYVKPLGEEVGEEISEEDKKRAFNYQPVWKRVAIVVAGPIFNLVLAYIIFVSFLSFSIPVSIPNLDELTNTTIEHILEDSPAMRAGFQRNDAVIAIEGKDIHTWVEMEAIVMDNPGKELEFKVRRNNNIIEMKAVPEKMNIVDMQGKEITIGNMGMSRMSNIVGGVLEGSPAERAGLKKDDIIVAIDETTVNDWSGMVEIISQSPDKELVLKVKRQDVFIDISITPEAKAARDRKGEEITVGRIGISKKMDVKIIEGGSIFMAPIRGLEAVFGWSTLTLDVVVKLFTGVVSAKQVGGPILIVNEASKAASRGFADYFNFIAIISINLAILNLLPVPVLDGGHVLFLSIEALRGKPLSEKMMMMANKVGMALLLLLITFVFYNDITRVVVPWVQKLLNPG